MCLPQKGWNFLRKHTWLKKQNNFDAKQFGGCTLKVRNGHLYEIIYCLLLFIFPSKPNFNHCMAHQHEDIFENRKQFQLERMILFSDAVFAIVITLLVIEIRVPENNLKGLMPSVELGRRLWDLVPHFLGFIMSFLVVSIFWQTHHRTFGYVTNYDGKLIWLNLMLLMMVCGVPFTTSLTSAYGYLDIAFSIYAINLGLISLMNFFIWMRISNPKHKLSSGMIDARLRRFGRARSLTICIIFFSGAFLCMFNVLVLSWIGRFIFPLIFPAAAVLKKIYRIDNV